jgi:hypothetical protein
MGSGMVDDDFQNILRQSNTLLRIAEAVEFLRRRGIALGLLDDFPGEGDVTEHHWEAPRPWGGASRQESGPLLIAPLISACQAELAGSSSRSSHLPKTVPPDEFSQVVFRTDPAFQI